MNRLVLLALVCSASLAGQGQAANLEQQIKTLKAVGPEGAGPAAARDAWRSVSAADPGAIPVLLAALDDANPLAANWLRASIDAIAQRELARGGKLPAAQLEKFALDTKHDPRARRLAFEWLNRVDSTAADRLIPGMLNDPGMEFRRDAVARVISEAEAKEKEGKPEDSAPVYRKALASARDLDQVEQIAKKLEGFGDKVDLPAHFGYLMDWKLIGPFDNTDEKAFDIVYPPEKEIKPAAEYPGKSGPVKWVDYTSTDKYGKVDLNKGLIKGNGFVGYAVAEFQSDKARPIELRLQTTNSNKIWLNGQLVASNNFYHAGSKIDQYIARGTLKPGKNVILLKILQNEMKEEWAQDWDYQIRVCDAVGTAVLSKDRGTAKGPQAGR